MFVPFRSPIAPLGLARRSGCGCAPAALALLQRDVSDVLVAGA